MIEARPIFVAGLERSGTSLLYALLASHPNIAMTRRTNLWTYFYDRFGDLSDPENLRSCLDLMMRYKRIVKLEPDRRRLEEDFARGEPTYGRLFALLAEQHAERLGKPRWGDKSLNTERYADQILAAYPGACIVHLVRDPRDRFASVHARWGDRRGGIGGATAEWLSSMALARRNRRRYPERYAPVRYEDLAAHPEAALRRICELAGERYVPEMLDMGGARSFREGGSNSSFGRREGGVISTDSIGRYRQVLTGRQIAFIQTVAASAMARFGYQPEPLRLTPAESVGLVTVDLPLELARLGLWRARERRRDRSGRRLPPYRLVPAETSA